jgi:hypothetical protein
LWFIRLPGWNERKSKAIRSFFQYAKRLDLIDWPHILFFYHHIGKATLCVIIIFAIINSKCMHVGRQVYMLISMTTFDTDAT